MANQYGPMLRRLRRRAGLTQEALADRAKLAVRTVRRLENGEHSDPRVGTMEALADALELTQHERVELLTAATNQTPEPQPQPEPEPEPEPENATTTGVVGERVGDDRLADAANQLAFELRTTLQREEEQRQIHDPVPLPVRWHTAQSTLIDSWRNIRMTRQHEQANPLNLDGELDQIVQVYQRIPSRRLVVLGRAGSGKSILAIRFVLGLLDISCPADPVPVIFSVGSWHPGTTPLRDWLIEQLLRDHPGLAARGPNGSTLAAALVETGRILPVLDGFDEIADGLHRAALAALNTTTLPLLVTSRVDEYRAAVAETDVLTSAAAVVLADLTAADLADYLPRTTRKHGPSDTVWEPVLREVREHPDGNLAAVLTTPLMISLARTIYSDTPDHDPAELLDTERYDTREAIERHLLGSFVPTVYTRQTHDIDRVQHWLGFLAHHLTRLGTHDLAWWQLGHRMPGWLRMVVNGVVLGVAGGVPAALVVGLLHTAGFGTADSGFLNGLSAVLAALPGEVLAVGMTVGLANGVALAFDGTAFEPSRVRIQLHGKRRSRATFLRRLAVGLVVGLGLGVGLGVANEVGASFWIVGQIGTSTQTVALFGLAFGLMMGLTWGVLASFEAPVDISTVVNPLDLLNANRRTVVLQSLIFGTVTCVCYMTAVSVLHGLRTGLTHGLPYGLAFGLEVGLGAASLTAWGTWTVFARVWLPLNGRLPWSLPALLEGAYQRGVLRRVGAVYQFRHAHLQDHLMHNYHAHRHGGV